MYNRVSIESPYAAATAIAHQQNILYSVRCVKDSLSRGEAPFASHLFYPQFLNDLIPEQRRQGLDASHEWRKVCDLIAVYTDHGISPGMQEAIALAELHGIPVEYRTLADATR